MLFNSFILVDSTLCIRSLSTSGSYASISLPGKIKIDHVVRCADPGTILSPKTAPNQMIGGDGLKWVNEIISQFGGDPGNVMIWGESGGGAKTSCLYAMPAAAPYFNKASIESGPGVRMMDKETANENTLQLLKELNIPVNNWQKILEVPAADLLSIQAKLPFVAPFLEKNKDKSVIRRNAGGFGPVVDGKALPNHPFDPTAPQISRNKPLLVGWNEDEYTFFAWERKDTESFKIDFDGLHNKLEPLYGQDTKKIIETYRKARPNATLNGQDYSLCSY